MPRDRFFAEKARILMFNCPQQGILRLFCQFNLNEKKTLAYVMKMC